MGDRLDAAYSEFQQREVPFPTREYWPIGSANKLNNNSVEIARTFGPGTYASSGGVASAHHDSFGRPGAGEIQLPKLRPSASLPADLTSKAGFGNPKLSALARNHERTLKIENARSGTLARAMRAHARQLGRQK